MRRYIILCCAVYARATCNASNVLPDEGIGDAGTCPCSLLQANFHLHLEMRARRWKLSGGNKLRIGFYEVSVVHGFAFTKTRI